MSAALVATAPERAASARILRAATALFRARGYHGSSMRTLARGLRMEAASLYYHFASKQEILFAILDRTLDDLLHGVGRAVAAADGPEARLRAAVRFHVLFHTDSQHEAFVSHGDPHHVYGGGDVVFRPRPARPRIHRRPLRRDDLAQCQTLPEGVPVMTVDEPFSDKVEARDAPKMPAEYQALL